MGFISKLFHKKEEDTKPIVKIREILYFDSEKANSLISQFEWGLTKSITISQENSVWRTGNVSIKIPKLFGSKLSQRNSSRNSINENREFHHDVLNRVESFLTGFGIISDLTNIVLNEGEIILEKIEDLIGNKPYIKSTGYCSIEDYSNLLLTTASMNRLINFVNRSVISNNPDNPAYNKLNLDLCRIETELKKAKTTNEQNGRKIDLNLKYEEVSRQIGNHVEQYIVEGLNNWVNTFIKDQLLFWMLPFPNCPSFQIICNLKRDAIIDKGIDHLISSYGTLPNQKFSVLGLVTSKEPPTPNILPFLDGISKAPELTKEKEVERAIRAMFPAILGLSNFLKFSCYPNIVVEPISIYRELN